MKKSGWILLSITLLLFCACGSVQPEETPSEQAPQVLTWQEQYDLGVRYLSEGNYQEAILAFSAAIGIEPMQLQLYTGRAEAYLQTDQSQLALEDYQTAVELGTTEAEIYRFVVQWYLDQGDRETAMEFLQRGCEATGDAELEAWLEKLEWEKTMEQDSFCNSEEFHAFDTLPEALQELLRQWLSLLTGGDLTALKDGLLSMDQALLTELKENILCSDGSQFDVADLRTMVNDYKVWFYHRTQEGGLPFCKLEIRPREGTAQYYSVAQQGAEEFLFYASGDCSGWNWNGAYAFSQTDGTYSSLGTGTVANGYLDGESLVQRSGSDGGTDEYYVSFTEGIQEFVWIDGCGYYGYVYGPEGKEYIRGDRTPPDEAWCHVYWTGATGMVLKDSANNLSWN